MNWIADIDKRVARALGKVRLTFRGVINIVNAAGQVQLVQLDGVAGEQLQDAELFQDYGYTSNPPKGTMAIVVPIGGRTAHGIVIATEHGTYRLKSLAAGEVAIYDDQGQKIHIKRGGIEINGGGKPVLITNAPTITHDSPQVNMTGNCTVTGLITGNGGMSITGGAGASITGNLTAAGGTFTHNGKNVGSTHQHANSGGVGTGGAPI